MRQDWVLDVLTDLKSFAQQNGMFSLSEHLDDTLMVAAEELAMHRGKTAEVDGNAYARDSFGNLASGEKP